MSRIHEALKKAEQERAATQGGSVHPGLATTPVAEPPVYADAPPTTMAAVAAAAANQGMPSFGGSFGLDTLLRADRAIGMEARSRNHAVHE